MASREFLLVLLVWLVIVVPLLVGAILLVRAAKNRSTITTLIGTCFLTLSPLIGALALGFRSFDALPYLFAALGLAGVGVLFFCAGFLGVCAKYGAAARRARELETLLVQLQQRMSFGG